MLDAPSESHAHLDRFIELMCEDHIGDGRDQSPDTYLLHLWTSDREAFCATVRGAVGYMSSIRGVDDCIMNVCLTIGPEVKDLVEEIALKRGEGSKWSSSFLTAALLLGSAKAADRFRSGFEKSFAHSLKSPGSSKSEISFFVETIAFLRLTSMADLVGKLAALKDTQYHRARKPPLWGIPARLMPERRRRWHNHLDCDAVKLAEAVTAWFRHGAAGLKQYLGVKGNSEYRARQYLFCLACERNPDDFAYFQEQYSLYTEAHTKNVCIEAMVYIDQGVASAAFLDKQLGIFNLARIAHKKGFHHACLSIPAHPHLFYCLLGACYYLRELNEGLIEKLSMLAGAAEADTATGAIVVLRKFGLPCKSSMVGTREEQLAVGLSSPAGILSRARSRAVCDGGRPVNASPRTREQRAADTVAADRR